MTMSIELRRLNMSLEVNILIKLKRVDELIRGYYHNFNLIARILPDIAPRRIFTFWSVGIVS